MSVHLIQNLRADAVVAFIGTETQVYIRFHRIFSLLLQLLRAYLIHKAYPSSLLIHIDDDPLSFGLDELHGFGELFTALAAQGAEYIARHTTGVYTA